MARNFFFTIAGASVVAMIAVLGTTVANAQVTVQNSPDSVPSHSGLANMNLSTLLTNAGIGSNVTTDQIAERAFTGVNGSTFSPQIDVLFSDNVRTNAAGYKPYHRIGWYQRSAGQGAPAESNIHDVVWENQAYVNGSQVSSQRLTSLQSDFTGLSSVNPFELRLTSATAGNDRGGSIYGNDAFNSAGFANMIYLKDRDLQGNVIPNSFIVAWEDLRGGGDKDYNDMVIRVKYVTAVAPVSAVPEAGTLPMAVAGGFSLLGTLGIVRRRKSA